MEEEILMLLVNFVALHLVLCFNQWNAKREQHDGRKSTNECEIKG